MAMTVEETKRLERKLIERGAKDFEALKDAFELARTIDDHEYGSELRRLSREHMRTETNKAITLYQKSLIFDSSVSFDCFMRALEFNRPPEEQFWLPRRKHLMHIAQALQDMEDGKLDELFLSCPPRVGKTTLIQMFLLWVMGKYPEKSNLYCSFSAKPVKTFYNGLLEVLRDPDTYLYGDVCPNKRLVATNADDNTIDIDRRKKYASFTGRSIDGSLNGSCDCNGYLVGDDLCEGIEEALSPTRMRSLWTTVDNNLIPRAKESCKRLWIGTRWALIDPQGIRMDLLTNDEHYKSVRWKYINTPALNEQDESNFDYQYGVGFSSDFYKQRRASFERNSDLASWFAQFQGEPIEREGAVFDPEYMRFYNGVLPEEKPDRVFIVVDPSWGGGDYVAAVTVAQYGNDLFVPAVVFSDADKTVTQPMIAAMAIKHGATAMKVEGTRMTASYGEDIDNRLRKDGIRMNVTINTSHFTGTGKRDRIIARASDIRERMIFLQDGIRPKEYVQFMQNMYSFTFTGKAIKHDDAPDVCAMVIDYVTVGNMSKAEIIQRPW